MRLKTTLKVLPNGAGKTTTIRMMMDIIKPDSGEVTILGEKLSEATKNKLGYLPEERGLLLVARLLRTYLLMYGKRPGLRVIVRNLRSGQAGNGK